MFKIPEGTICQVCNEYPAETVYSESTIAAVHGCFAYYCRVCVLREQVKAAEEAAARLPMLRLDLQVALTARKGTWSRSEIEAACKEAEKTTRDRHAKLLDKKE